MGVGKERLSQTGTLLGKRAFKMACKSGNRAAHRYLGNMLHNLLHIELLRFLKYIDFFKFCNQFLFVRK